MALIGKIREHSGLAVGIIAAGLLLFVVGGEIMKLIPQFSSENAQDIAEIAGKTVKYDEYNALVEELKANFEASQGRPADEYSMQNIRQQAWEQLIVKHAYQNEFNELGLEVTAEEVVDMVQGKNIHPMLANAFKNPQTGQFDVNQVRGFLQAIKSSIQAIQAGQQPQVPVAQIQSWYSFEKQLGPERLRKKYESLMRLSTYVTKAEAKKSYLASQTKADFKYLFVPYYSIVDSTVKVTDEQLEDYLSKHKEEFKIAEAKASVDYVSFPIVPSAKDSLAFGNELTRIATEFAATKDDSAFVRANAETAQLPYYTNLSGVPQQLKDKGLVEDVVVGPVNEGNAIKFYKLAGVRNDSVYSIKASHILIAPTEKTDAAKAIAKTKAEDLLKQLKGGADFATLARANSTDPGSGQNGGDLGWFKEKQMVKPFNDAVFSKGTPGLIANVIESDFGFHIIKITEPKTNKEYLVATVDKQLVPSSETQEAIYQKAQDFLSKSRTKDAFVAEAKKANIPVSPGDNFTKNSTYVAGLSEVRGLVRWVFKDAKVGDVSKEVFSCGNNYVVAVVKSKVEEGYPKAADIKDELTAKVRKGLKAKTILEKLNKTKGTFEQIAAAYGPSAQVNVAPETSFGYNSFGALGEDPATVGKSFALAKVGAKTAALEGENGVAIIELLKKTTPTEIADYSQQKNQMIGNSLYRTEFNINTAIKDAAKIEDNRYKFE